MNRHNSPGGRAIRVSAKPRPTPAAHRFELYALCGVQPDGRLAVVMLPLTTVEAGPSMVPAVGGKEMRGQLREVAKHLAPMQGAEMKIVRFDAGVEVESFAAVADPPAAQPRPIFGPDGRPLLPSTN